MVMSVRPLDQTTWPGAACGIPTEDGSGSSWERFLITLSSMKKLAVTPVSSISIDAVGIAVANHVAGDLDGVDACHRSRRTEKAAVALGLKQGVELREDTGVRTARDERDRPEVVGLRREDDVAVRP